MTVQLADGAELAGFRIETLLGRGGMASVYLAHDLRLGRKVALKVLSPELAASPQFQRRFHRESRLLASLDHPNIVPVYQAGEANGLLYIAMRYVEGSDLNALLDRDGRLDPPVALRVLLQVAAALQAAHEAGLVHRDVKPDNVLVSGESSRHAAGHVYLTDFGLTKRLSSLSNLTAVGSVMGTMQYLAPEQISGRPVDVRTDIYALGGLAFRCLTGLPPFDRENHAAQLWAHLSEAPPPASECCPDLPEAVDDVLWTAMAKQPEDRYASAAEFAAALTTALETAPETAPVAAQPAGPRVPLDRSPVPAGTVGGAPPVTAAPPVAGSVGGAGSGGRLPGGARAGGPRRLVLVGGVLVVALIAVAAVMFAGRGGGGGGGSKLIQSYPAGSIVPFDVSVPAGWVAKDDGGYRTVFSPRAVQLLALFTESGSAQSWTATWQQVQRDPAATVGLYTFPNTEYDLGQTSENLKLVLPATATFDQPSERLLDGTATYVREGDLTNPADGRQQLHFLCYVVQRPAGAGMVHLLFLAPPKIFDSNRNLFDRIADTVHFR